MTQLQQPTTDDRPGGGGGRPGHGAAGIGEHAVETIVATADAVQADLRDGQDAVAKAVQQWADRLVGIPFTALCGGGVARIVAGQVWVDSTFEVVDLLLAVQRRSFTRLLGLQQRAADLIVESGLAVATASGAGSVGDD